MTDYNSAYDDISGIEDLLDTQEVRERLLKDFLFFCRVFYKLKTGREFIISSPPGREAHVITIAKELTKAFRLEEKRLLVNVPPGHHKSTLLCLWVAWCYAHYPDCNFLYISVSYELAEKHTAFIKEVMELPYYVKLFGVRLRTDSKAKGKFKTEEGGACAAFGAKGAVVGNDAGLPNISRFSGAIVMDDMHNPDQVLSNTIRQSVIDNFNNTIAQRARGHNVPFIFIGQRVHEDDLPAYFISGKEGYKWKSVVLPSLDLHDNPLYPEVFSKEMLLIKREQDPYNFFSQHQQTPQPPGGSLFMKEWFVQRHMEPDIISTFLSIDTAETDKAWNDATAMSFFGLFKIKFREIDSGLYGLHWLDCREVRIEPKDLENEFYDFYSSCMRHKVKPSAIVIERKSTGVTLASVLKSVPGLRVIDVGRSAADFSKGTRFKNCQSFIASNRITFTEGARHVEMCLEHMAKITPNCRHAHDDIADTLQLAIQCALVDNILAPVVQPGSEALKVLASDAKQLSLIRQQSR